MTDLHRFANWPEIPNTGRIAILGLIGVFLLSCSSKKPTDPTSFTITASAGVHGTISPSGSVSVQKGADQSFAISPDSGYVIFDVTVDNALVGPVTSYSFTNVTANHSIHSAFVQSLNPDRLAVDSGLYYRGEMGSSALLPHLVIRAVDAAGNRFPGRWIHLNKFVGNGTLSADSMLTDSTGAIHPQYTFSGYLGHAIIEAALPQSNSLYVYLRASTILWGDSAQGEFLKLDDPYSLVKGFDGLPERVDIIGGVIYAVYETARGVKVALDDYDLNGIPSDPDRVSAIFLTAPYSKTLANGIGINSTIGTPGVSGGAVDSAFGPADSVGYDGTAWVYKYRTEGITFYSDNQATRRVIEIQLVAPKVTHPAYRKNSDPSVMSD